MTRDRAQAILRGAAYGIAVAVVAFAMHAYAFHRAHRVSHEVVITTTHSMAYLDLRHDFFRVCTFVFWNALLVNLLPPTESLSRYPRLQEAYCFLVDLMSFFALNFRRRLPSLDLPPLFFELPTTERQHSWRRRRSA